MLQVSCPQCTSAQKCHVHCRCASQLALSGVSWRKSSGPDRPIYKYRGSILPQTGIPTAFSSLSPEPVADSDHRPGIYSPLVTHDAGSLGFLRHRMSYTPICIVEKRRFEVQGSYSSVVEQSAAVR